MKTVNIKNFQASEINTLNKKTKHKKQIHLTIMFK